MEEEQRTVEYWNKRADNYGSSPRHGNAYRLTDDELNILHHARTSPNAFGDGTGGDVYDIKKKREYQHRHGGDAGFQFNIDDAVKEYEYRQAIKNANGNPAKIAQINNQYVRDEWMDYHNAKRKEEEAAGRSWEDWLMQQYGTRIDPAASFRLETLEAPTTGFPKDKTRVNPPKNIFAVAREAK